MDRNRSSNSSRAENTKLIRDESSSYSYGATEPPTIQEIKRDRPSLASSLGESIRLAIDSSFALRGRECSIRSIRDLGGNATLPSEMVNIAKNLIGAGVLSLSGGIAMYADSKSAVLSASFWIVLLGTIFGYFCLLIAKVCKITHSATYRECWENTMGLNGAFFVSFAYAIKPAMGNLAYSAILSQTLQSLLETAGINVSRIEALFLVTVVAILPLCLLKNLNVLAPFSVLGTTGIVATTIAMCIRYLDGSYQPGGKYFDDIAESLQPLFGESNHAWSPKVFPYTCMIFEAFVMHYNSPRFYAELKDPSIRRFGSVVSGSFGFSAITYVLIASAGYLTFGGNSDGYILNNYSPMDPLATFCRMAIATSTLLTYPIVFMGFRDGILDVLAVPPEKQTSSNLNVLTVILLTIITLLAVVLTDLGVINAVGGGSVATIICFVFPTIMYRKAIRDMGGMAAPGQKRESAFALILMIFGCILGVIGVWEALI